jgi:hypothetical protein
MNPDDDLGIDVLAMPARMRTYVIDSRAARGTPPVPHAPPEALLHLDRLAVHITNTAPEVLLGGWRLPLRRPRAWIWRLVDLAILALMPFGVLGLLLGVLVLWRVGLPGLLKLLGD